MIADGRARCAILIPRAVPGAARGSGRRIGLGHRDRPAAAQLEVQALSQRRRQQQRLGGPQPPGPLPIAGAAGLAEDDMYEEAGPGATLAFCDFNHGNPGLVGGGMLANEFIALPYVCQHSAARGAALGTGAQGIPAPQLQADACASWGRCRKCRSSTAAWRSIPASRIIGGFPWCGSPGIAIRTTSRSPASSSRRPKPC